MYQEILWKRMGYEPSKSIADAYIRHQSSMNEASNSAGSHASSVIASCCSNVSDPLPRIKPVIEGLMKYSVFSLRMIIKSV